MSKTKLSDFVQRERNYIDHRCQQPFESTFAPEQEFKLFEERMRAIDSLETLYQEAERELASMRATLEQIDQSPFRSASRKLLHDAPPRSQTVGPVAPQPLTRAA